MDKPVKPASKRLKRTNPFSRGIRGAEGGDGPSTGEIVEFSAPIIDQTILPRFSAGVDQRFEDSINLDSLPSDLQRRIQHVAPFVLGFRDAKYDIDFFSRTAGLCKDGPHPRTGVTTQMMPNKELDPAWKPAMAASRITLSLVEDEDLRLKYEDLYARVYGGKPDNGSIAMFFVRAASYYFDKNKSVNWAGLAMELWQQRNHNPEGNPQKLVPPCLGKQVQGIIDEVGLYLKGKSTNPSRKPTNLSDSGGPSSDAPGGSSSANVYARHLEVELNRTEVQSANSEVWSANGKVNQLIYQILPESKEKVNNAEKTLNKHTEDLAFYLACKKTATGDSLESMKRQFKATAKTVAEAQTAVEHAEEEFNNVEFQLKAAKEDYDEKKLYAKTVESDLQFAMSKVGIYPQHVFHKLPDSRLDMQSSLIDTMRYPNPCPHCGRFFLANAVMPLSCGCDYHPACLRDVIVKLEPGSEVVCGACGLTTHGTWLAQWGFPMHESNKAELDAELAVMDAATHWVPAPWGKSRTHSKEPWVNQSDTVESEDSH